MASSSPDDFLHHLCKSASAIRLLLTITVSISVLMLLWVPFTDLNTGTGAIVGMNLLLGLVFTGFFGGLLLLCRRRQATAETEFEAEPDVDPVE